MKSEFEKYCAKIELSKLQITRIDQILTEYASLLNEPILDIFINEDMKEDGTRMYHSLWCFTASNLCELRTFLTADDYDMAYIKKRIKYIHITKGKYEFNKRATNKSRISIDVSLTELMICQFRASGNNCPILMDIYYKYFLPNIISY